MTTLPRATISPMVSPSCGTSQPLVSTHSQLPGRNQFDSLTRFDGGTLLRRKHIMLRAWFADRDEGRGLCHAVDVRNFPAQFSFDCSEW